LTGLYNLAYNPVKEKDLCDMDTEKWKSILVPKDVYLEIKKIAAKEGRTLGGQLRFIYSQNVSEEQKRVKELVDAEMTLRKAKDHSVMS
jgi:hypothetical protein